MIIGGYVTMINYSTRSALLQPVILHRAFIVPQHYFPRFCGFRVIIDTARPIVRYRYHA